MKFQRSVVHWRSGILPWFVVGPPTDHWMRLASQNLNRSIQNTEEAQELLQESMIRIYLKCPRLVTAEFLVLVDYWHVCLTAIYHVQRKLYHCPSTHTRIAHTQCNYSSILTVRFSWEIASAMRTIQVPGHQGSSNCPMSPVLLQPYAHCFPVLRTVTSE